MSTDIKDLTDTVEEVAFGAAETAAEVASNPIGAVRKQVKGLERKGTPAARRLNRRVNAQLTAATEPARDAFRSIRQNAASVAAQLQPERIAIKGLRLVKVQARRSDAVGEIAKQTLRLFNRSFRTVARVATRLEGPSELAAHPAARTAAGRRPAGRRARTRAA